MPVVWTNGCFDLLHAGHVTFLERAATLGTLTVFLNSDKSIKELKGNDRPIIPVQHRRKMLQALRCVSYVHVFDGPNPVAYWESLRSLPHMYVKDTDCDVMRSAEGQWLAAQGVVLTLLPRLPEISTTQIIKSIREQGGVSR